MRRSSAARHLGTRHSSGTMQLAAAHSPPSAARTCFPASATVASPTASRLAIPTSPNATLLVGCHFFKSVGTDANAISSGRRLFHQIGVEGRRGRGRLGSGSGDRPRRQRPACGIGPPPASKPRRLARVEAELQVVGGQNRRVAGALAFADAGGNGGDLRVGVGVEEEAME
jgi:hypothetical protein